MKTRWFAFLAVVPAAALLHDARAQTRSMEDATLTLASLDRRIADLDMSEASARKEIQDSESKMKGIQEKLRSHTRVFYRQAKSGAYAIGNGFEEFMRQVSHVERSRRILFQEVEELRTLRSRSLVLGETIENNRKDRARLTSERNQLESIRAAFSEESRRQEAYEHAFETSTRPSSYTAVYGAVQSGSESTSADRFEGAKGRLLMPIAGRAEVRSVRRSEANGPGIEIKAELGTPVRSTFPGRVAFADRYGAFGKIVILDHGDHYYTVSGNLASIDVRVGDEVSQGARIGTVGDDGRGASLYFEVRRGSQTISPTPWFGL